MNRAQPQRLADYLRHVFEAVDNILDYTAGMDWPTFLADRKTQDAVVRNLEIIGEACNNVVEHYPEFAQLHNQVLWSFAYEMRNALSHGYFTVDYTIVWQTIQADLPGLKVQISSLV